MALLACDGEIDRGSSRVHRDMTYRYEYEYEAGILKNGTERTGTLVIVIVHLQCCRVLNTVNLDGPQPT